MRQKIEKQKKLSSLEQSNNKAAEGWKARIDKAMKEKRLSQRALATLSNLGSTSIRHLLTNADTVSMESLRRISNALNMPISYLAAGVYGTIEGDDDQHRRVRILKIHLPHEELDRPPEKDHGVAVVLMAGMPEKLFALRVQDNSMTPFGQNGAFDPEHVLVRGETVIWSTEVRARPGGLCVAKLPDGSLAVRSLSLNDEGKNVLVALNSNFPRTVIHQNHILGSVLQSVQAHQLQ